ncbi:hypothetical protein M9H77_36183 [Catharanthus roseus]|uniref:Uncharacterized protein n=1 Tax=Catharanthus roseus TaxID=4058 RepID=A0ACB9ZRG5_CATRO|nr:hypothetical protein M9H77_36183 [Catharanthus roseus]
MEYTWSNSSRERMEAMRKQEDYQSKLTRDMHNFYHDGGNRVNAYGGINHGSVNFTPKRYIGVANFSLHARSYEHNSYDFPRNEIRNEGNYVKMDDRFYKRREDVERYHNSYDHYEHSYGTWEQKVESLFYSYGGRREVLIGAKSLSYEVNVWWDCECENRRRTGAKPIEKWSLMK